METALEIDVSRLDDPHRRALEEVVGRHLKANQRLLIQFTEVPAADDAHATQSLDEWTGFYEGLSDQEIDDIDQVVKTRANLTRDLP